MACRQSDSAITQAETFAESQLQDAAQWFNSLQIIQWRNIEIEKINKGVEVLNDEDKKKISSLYSIVFSLIINEPLRLT